MMVQWLRHVMKFFFKPAHKGERIETDFGSIQDAPKPFTAEQEDSTANPAKLVDTLASNVQEAIKQSQDARVKREQLNYLQCANRLDEAFYQWLLNSHDIALNAPLKHSSPSLILAHNILEQNLHADEQLPRKPASLPMLIRLLKDNDISLEEICKTLLSDPSLTDKLLKTANAPIFRRSVDPIVNIDQAVLSLGLNGIQRVVSTLVMQPMLKPTKQAEKAFSERVWDWAQLSALGCDLYCKTEGKEQGAWYLCGLLPALSLLQIYRQISSEPALITSLEQEPQTTFVSIYQECVNRHAWPLCREIRSKWGLPEHLDQVLQARQHQRQSQYCNPLSSAMHLASYQVLAAQQSAPLGDDEIELLCQSEAGLNQRILARMQALYEQHKAA